MISQEIGKGATKINSVAGSTPDDGCQIGINAAFSVSFSFSSPGYTFSSRTTKPLFLCATSLLAVSASLSISLVYTICAFLQLPV